MHIDPKTLLLRPEFIDRHRALRVLCLGMMGLLTLMAVFVVLVVRYALGGKPLSGNAAMLGGIPILTVIAAMVTLAAPILATLISSFMLKSGIESVALEPPHVPESGADLETDADRLWRVYSSGKFVQYALSEGAILVCAVLYHLSADPLMMLFVLGMLLYMASRFPTSARILAWFEEAVPKVAELRESRIT